MKAKSAFTIIEVLVVVTIIGILASLSFVVWTGFTDRAVVASLQSDVTNAGKTIQGEFNLGNGLAYATSLSSLNNGKGITASSGNTLVYTYNNTSNPLAFCVSAYNGTKSYMVSSTVPTATLGSCGNAGIVTSGLVLSLDPGDAASYPGKGSTFYAISPTVLNGTIVNSPTFSTTNSGIFTFVAASTQQVTFANDSSLQFLNTSPYTLDVWVKPTTNPGANNWTGIFNREANLGLGRDGYNLYFLGSASTSTYFTTERFQSGTNTNASITVDQSASVNSWSHLVATYDGSTLKLYRNGTLASSVSSTGNITNATTSLTIGNRGGQYFTGSIGKVTIYNRALSVSEVNQNYNFLRGRYGI